ncbi:bluetail domain-containing putative surface protein, partial [Cyanobium sp. Copco_Reservoir_LC18]|uniref:bluetail domain-containing putative surface protein n=1 Tax=Cyanobium sp. Copco_Reservoir_LC18 TaxID=1328305 RepID=UPI002714674C
ATLGTDYTGISATGTTKTVTFAAGSATATVVVDPTADTTVEANETVVLTLATGSGYAIGTTGAVTGTITNDEVAPVTLPSISLALSPAAVEENGTANLVYTFTRSGSTSAALSVNYTVGGSATNGSDYTGISSAGTTKTVTFAAGSATAVVTVDPTADTTVEANETVALTLATGSGYTIGTTGAVTGTISNDDLVSPPPPSPGGYIPLTWNDPIFASVVERTSTLVLGPGESASNVSIVNDSGISSVNTNGDAVVDRVRSRTREGIRPRFGEQYFSNMYIEAYGMGTDHADALQIYSPGSEGRLTIRNSTLRVDGQPGTPNAAYFTDWNGANVLENVLLSGGGISLYVAGNGGRSLSLKNVYIERTGNQYIAPYSFDLVNGVRVAIVRWENVRWASTVNGQLVLGDLIPQPYGVARDYTDAITGIDGRDIFALTTSRNIYVGQNGNDIFSLTSLNQSLFPDYDFITDFSIGYDVIDGPNTQPITPVIISGQPTALSSAAIANLLNSSGNFNANAAAIFTFGGTDGRQIFLALNDSVAGYSASNDAIIEITGYSGNLSQLQVI